MIGNRDGNKVRLTSELEQKEIERVMDVEGPYWIPEDKRVTPKMFLTRIAAAELNITEVPGAHGFQFSFFFHVEVLPPVEVGRPGWIPGWPEGERGG